MKIAYVTSQERGKIDHLLSTVAEQLQANGRSLVGIVRVPAYESQFANGCDMKVRVLPVGPEIKITQNLGEGSDACRLDPGAIATAVSNVDSNPNNNADLFILNKFGPEEASGRGFVFAIGKALEHGIPVLVGVGPANQAAFDTFAGGLAETLPDELDAILQWCATTIDSKSKRTTA